MGEKYSDPKPFVSINYSQTSPQRIHGSSQKIRYDKKFAVAKLVMIGKKKFNNNNNK